MSVSDLLAAVRAATPLAPHLVADLAAFELFALHWDERESAITASFEGSLDEAGRVAMGAPEEHDWVVFHLRFPRADQIEVRGWSYEPMTEFACEPNGERLSLVITGPHTDVRFTADPADIVHSRTLHAAPI
jgi:hypothetical protein